jgi:hypothetical protein
VQLLADRAEAAVLADAGERAAPARDCDGRLFDQDGLASRAGIDEVRQALRLSLVAAGNRVSLARALHTGPIIAVGQALRAGQVSLAHARVALEHTEDRPEAVVADMLARGAAPCRFADTGRLRQVVEAGRARCRPDRGRATTAGGCRFQDRAVPPGRRRRHRHDLSDGG